MFHSFNIDYSFLFVWYIAFSFHYAYIEWWTVLLELIPDPYIGQDWALQLIDEVTHVDGMYKVFFFLSLIVWTMYEQYLIGSFETS